MPTRHRGVVNAYLYARLTPQYVLAPTEHELPSSVLDAIGRERLQALALAGVRATILFALADEVICSARPSPAFFARATAFRPLLGFLPGLPSASRPSTSERQGPGGGRVDGIPRHDLVGSSDGFRRPVVIAYLDPGLTVTRGKNSVFINIPVNAYTNFRPSAVDQQLGFAGGGDLAKYLVLAAYQIRF
jgi:hypothetical protein